MLKTKTEKKLMIVGNSVEKDKIFVGKNEVEIQIDHSTKENTGILEGKSFQKQAISKKLNPKINRRITEFSEHLKLDRFFKP
jgi:hypothetical protein